MEIVYFLRLASSPRVMVSSSTQHAAVQCRSLQEAHPDRLSVAGWCYAASPWNGPSLAAAIRRRVEPHRVRGKWFVLTQDMVALFQHANERTGQIALQTVLGWLDSPELNLHAHAAPSCGGAPLGGAYRAAPVELPQARELEAPVAAQELTLYHGLSRPLIVRHGKTATVRLRAAPIYKHSEEIGIIEKGWEEAGILVTNLVKPMHTFFRLFPSPYVEVYDELAFESFYVRGPFSILDGVSDQSDKPRVMWQQFRREHA